MICKPCRMAADSKLFFELHDDCLGKTHCDCQHKPVGTGIEKKVKANGTEEN